MKAVLLPLALMFSTPVAAEVVAPTETGFTIRHSLSIAAPPERVWAMLVRPSAWWDAGHSYSGDAANISIDLRGGGCWCEKLPDGGSVEHMRVLYVRTGRTLRFAGGLGPLQSMPVTGIMTFSITSDSNATTLSMTYVVAGAGGLAALAAPVDRVLGEQLPRLKAAAEKASG